MNKTLHFEGFAEKLDLAELLSDNYSIDLGFGFEEPSKDTIKNVFLRFYECDEKCTLDEALKGHLNKMFGKLEAEGQEYGYSEYTIEGFTISKLKLGGHDLKKIFADKAGKYLHVLIDVIK